MSCLSFKKEANVYIVDKTTDAQYRLDISEINFVQTFTEHTYSNKTLQIQNMFEQSVINKANPANFDFIIPVLRENDLDIVLTRTLDYQPFDLYITTQQAVFKIESGVIFSATFILDKNKPLGLSISGQGIKLTFEGSADSFTVPGTPVARSLTRTYNKFDYVNIILDGASITDPISNLEIELTNDIVWTPYTTATFALAAINAGTSMYPSGYTLNKRNLSGSFSLYSIGSLSWSTDSTLFIEVGQRNGATYYGFEFNMDPVTIQKTVATENIFKQPYTWRSTQNPANLSQVISWQ